MCPEVFIWLWSEPHYHLISDGLLRILANLTSHIERRQAAPCLSVRAIILKLDDLQGNNVLVIFVTAYRQVEGLSCQIMHCDSMMLPASYGCSCASNGNSSEPLFSKRKRTEHLLTRSPPSSLRLPPC